MKALFIAPLAAICILTANADPANAQASRTWVSGVGDDVNPCSRTAPCKTFAGAISKTAAEGEINCLDPGGFGAVTITKSITIDCNGTYGSILASATNGVNINGANILVVLRNLSISGNFTGLVGINFISGLSLELDNVTVYRFNSGNASGIRFAPNTANAILRVNNSLFSINGISPSTGGGIVVAPAGGNAIVVINNTKFENNSVGINATSTSGAITMTVQDSSIGNSRGFGINATAGSPINLLVDRTGISNSIGGIGLNASGGNAFVRVNNSIITGNSTGVAASGGATLRSYKNNAINGNGADGTPITQENLN